MEQVDFGKNFQPCGVSHLKNNPLFGNVLLELLKLGKAFFLREHNPILLVKMGKKTDIAMN